MWCMIIAMQNTYYVKDVHIHSLESPSIGGIFQLGWRCGGMGGTFDHQHSWPQVWWEWRGQIQERPFFLLTCLLCLCWTSGELWLVLLNFSQSHSFLDSYPRTYLSSPCSGRSKDQIREIFYCSCNIPPLYFLPISPCLTLSMIDFLNST